MSTGADCQFVEVEPGKWKYRIQRWPYGEWPEYDKHGPFDSFTEALNHLDNNYANPGGWSVHTHRDHIHEWKHDTSTNTTYCESCGEENG